MGTLKCRVSSAVLHCKSKADNSKANTQNLLTTSQSSIKGQINTKFLTRGILARKVREWDREREREREGEREGERKRERGKIVAKALDGQRYPLPLCLLMKMCGG